MNSTTTCTGSQPAFNATTDQGSAWFTESYYNIPERNTNAATTTRPQNYTGNNPGIIYKVQTCVTVSEGGGSAGDFSKIEEALWGMNLFNAFFLVIFVSWFIINNLRRS